LLSFLSGWLVGENVDIAVKTVVNEYHWPPNQIDNLFLDDYDYHGLKYWYDNAKEMHDKMKTP
tara:strand:+ start:519 stop:707 length:189 start_codon:yes stop_codon:yes gene_type:complete